MPQATILDSSFGEIASYVQSCGEKSFRAKQIFEWIYRHGILDFDQMTNIPPDLRRKIKADFPFPVFSCQSSSGLAGQTRKYLLELNDGQKIETVAIPASGRLTVCVSSQAGCKFACRFCASGVGGWARDLTCGEMVMQVLYAQSLERRRVTHIVFMGTGEPLDNWPAVSKAIEMMNSSWGMGIAARRITVSTCGIIPGLKALAQFNRQIELAVSLHGHNDQIRGSLMPVSAKYPLADLMAACREYTQATRRQITFEYLLIDPLTSTEDAARGLGRLLKGMLCKVNLIPYNPVKEFEWKTPARQDIYAFRDILIAQGVHATIRWSKGQQADGACGQLRSQTL